MSTRVASLSAEITANVAGFQQAAQQVKAGLNGIANEAKKASAPLGDYSNAANEITALNKSFAGSQGKVNKAVEAGTSSLLRGLSAGSKWNSVLMEGAKAAGLNSSQVFGMAEASNLWTKSQLASASAAEILTKRSYQLGAAVHSGNMTAKDAGKLWGGYVKEQEQAIRGSMTFGEKVGALNQKLDAGAMGLMKFGAAAVGVGMAVKSTYDFAKAGASLDYTQYRFDRLSKSIGTTSSALLVDLRAATRNTVSDADLMGNAMNFMALGMAKSREEVLRLSKVASALNMDMGELTLTLANQSTRRFDQLGVSLDGFKDKLEALKNTGMDTDAAFKEAFLQQAEEQVKRVGNVADSSLGSFKALEAEAKNFWNLFTTKAATASQTTVTQMATTMRAVNMAMNGAQWENFRWDSQAGQVAFDVVPYAESQKAANEAYRNYLAASENVRPSAPVGMGGAYNQAEQERRARDFYQANQRLGMQEQRQYAAYAQRTPQAKAAAAVGFQDYGLMLSSGLDVSKMTADYREKVSALNAALGEENEKLSQLSKRYGENSKQVTEQRGKVDELRAGVMGLGQDYKSAMNEAALGMLKAKNASDQQMLNYALASKQISQDAYNQSMAMGKLSDAYLGGEISAQAYSTGVANLQNMIKGLSGMQVNAYVDVWVRQHGSIPSNGNINQVGSFTANTGQAAAANWLKNNRPKWTGGPLAGSGITLVGDAPGGGLTPYTEAIINGFVVDAKTTRKMYEAGLLEGAANKYIGDEGQVGSYYTPPTPVHYQVPTPNAPHVRNRRQQSAPVLIGTQASAQDTGAPSTFADAGSTQGASMQVSAQSVAKQTAESVRVSGQQTVQAQKESGSDIVEAINKLDARLAKQPTKDDMYNLFHSGQAMSI